MPNVNASGKWSRKHERCVRCASTERPHRAYGFCSRCRDATPERKEVRKVKTRDAYRKTREAASEGRWSKRWDACRDCGRSDQPYARWGRCEVCAEKDLKFPRLGAMCRIVPTKEIGRIVGYSSLYGEWCVRVDGEPDLPWEPCDLAPLEGSR